MSRFLVVCSVRNRSTLVVLALVLAAGAAYGVLRMNQTSAPQEASAPNPAPPAAAPPATPSPPAEVRPTSIYSEVRSDRLNPATVGALTRVYVPNLRSRTVSVIDPETFKVADDKLYLFYNKFFTNTLPKWNSDEADLKAKADNNWKKTTDKP